MAAGGGGGGALDGEEGWGGGTRTRPSSDYTRPPQPQLQMQTTTTTTTLTSPVLEQERASYGVGGSRAIRRSGRKSVPKPYERPPPGGSRLGSGFSKIITTGATYLYSSIFRRRLPAPVQVSNVEVQELDANEQISSPSADDDCIQAGNCPVGHVENHDQSEPDVANSSVSDVENLLKKKTLSRDEFQRLSVLLQSRVVSNGVDKKQRPKQVEVETRSSREEVHLSDGNQSEAQRWRQDLQKSREERENGVRTLTVYDYGRSSSATPAVASEKLDALAGSPVEVAIAFMGGRASQQAGTPPVEPLNQRDENRLSSGPPPTLHISQTPSAKRAAPDYLNEDLFRTPPPPSVYSSWGRNRTVSRTPYSRPLRLQPPRERAIDGTFGTPSSTRWTPIRTPVTGGREMLKRRSTVLDEGWTSGGPIRRTRHKAIVPVTPSNLSQSRGGLAFPMTPFPASSSALPSPIGGKLGVGTLSPRKAVTSPAKEKELLTESGNFYVPAQSSETARKILETLEKMTPSPQGKALGDELAIVRGRPPAALTEGMLNDQARKSMTFIEYSTLSDSREPGPSGRDAEESPSSGYPAPTLKSDPNAKAKGKGKASLPPTENGPGGSSGLLSAQERIISAGDGSVKQVSARPNVTDAILASETDKGKGFRMNAVFEESGSEDEGRLANSSLSNSSLPSSISKLPNAIPKSSTPAPAMFGTSTLSSTTISGPSFPATSDFAVEKTVSSSGFTFTFPTTRASLEGPPTPKAMSPAATSPKAIPATPLFPFAQATVPPTAAGLVVEPDSAAAKVESHNESKSEFSFGLPPAPVASVAQPVPKLQLPLESKTTFFNTPNSFFGTPSSTAAPAMFSTLTPGVATSSSPSSSSKFGDTFTAPTSSAALKVGAIPISAPPFLASSSSSMFGSGSGSFQSASSIAPSMSLFGSNSGTGTTPSTNLFTSSIGTGTSGSVAPGLSGFGQSNAFSFKTPATTAGPLVSPDSQASAAKDSSTQDPERPQKRSMSSFQQPDISKRQQPVVTMPSHSFTAFGTSVGTSASTPAIPVTFAAGSSSMTTSQDLFPSPFGQASSSAPQISSALPSAVPVPFTFGTPASAAGTASTLSGSSVGFGSTPSFPSFSSSVYGTPATGSSFGVTPAAPLAFGSSATTAPAFGSASANSTFGAFVSEAVSPPPSAVPAFGSGFTSPSPSPTPAFPFGPVSPAFSFGGAASSSSSGAAYTFGSSGTFPFTTSKSVPASPQPSIFGLSSSVPAFGSTTNGTMSSDVVVLDQSNMDDNSMAEEPTQMGGSVSPQPSVFGAQSSVSTGSFVFGGQGATPGALGPTSFGVFPPATNPTGFAPVVANPFAVPQPGGSLDFDPPTGGAFALGSGGDRTTTRKIFKAKRITKRGK